MKLTAMESQFETKNKQHITYRRRSMRHFYVESKAFFTSVSYKARFITSSEPCLTVFQCAPPLQATALTDRVRY
jgi:hypothetical protein